MEQKQVDGSGTFEDGFSEKGGKQMARKDSDYWDGAYSIDDFIQSRNERYEAERWGKRSAKQSREAMIRKLKERNQASNFDKDLGN